MKRLRSLAAIVFVLTTTGYARADNAPVAAPTTPAVALQDGDLLAICGDSITEQKKYSVYMQDYLLMCQPVKVKTLQAGWGGETAQGFTRRMATDVLNFKPSVATTCYGMNDGNYTTLSNQSSSTYRKAETDMIRQFKAAGVRSIIVGSPGVVDTNSYHKTGGAEMYNKTLSQLTDIGREVASQEGVAFADLHNPMMDVMQKAKAKYGDSYQVAGPDGIHPGGNGHLIMAYTFLKALGCDGNIGTITMDLPAGAATASDGHKVISAEKGLVDLESTRYPFCFFGNPEDSSSSKGILEFLPFNQDLNRFTLVVKGTDPAANYKVTWGTTSQTFSGQQLQAGINLAAEFMDNPFSDAFKAVDSAVSKQQSFETVLTKQFLMDLSLFKENLPEETATFDDLTTKMLAKDTTLQTASIAAVKPVKHEIKVEPVAP